MSDFEGNPIDLIDEAFAVDDDEEATTYAPEGTEAVEFVYRVYAHKAVDDSSELGDKLESGWYVEGLTLVKVYNRIMDDLKQAEDYIRQKADDEGVSPGEVEDSVEPVKRAMVADDVFLLFTLAHEMIRGISGDIILEEGFTDRLSDSIQLARNLDAPVQERVLYEMDVIDEGMKGEIANIRKTRNQLVHETRERQYLLDMGNIESRLNRTMTTIYELHSEVYDTSFLHGLED
jgi:hypothetical protein